LRADDHRRVLCGLIVILRRAPFAVMLASRRRSLGVGSSRTAQAIPRRSGKHIHALPGTTSGPTPVQPNCLQQWYNLSNSGTEEALYDFRDLELGRNPIPDETTILNFRHLLEAHELTKSMN
jgi:hypothetical protein